MASQHRWWFVDRFSRKPGGTRTQVSGERFASLMSKLDVSATVELPDHLGNAATRSFSLRFDRPRVFRLGDVIDADPTLSQLSKLASTLRRQRDATPAKVADQVERVVGPGHLVERLRGHDEPPPPRPSTSASELTSGASISLDAILDDVQISRTPTIKSGLDAFVGAILGSRPRARVVPKATRDSGADMIEQAVTQTAVDFLSHPDVASLEASWRALKMVMGATPGHEFISIELVDADPQSILDALRMPTSARERPDAIFVGMQLNDPTILVALAEFGQQFQIPIIASVDEGLPFANLNALEETEASEPWTALRSHPAAPWLAAVMNPVVLVNEDTPLGPRLLGGSPAFAIAAMLAAQYDRTTGLQPISGPSRGWTPPAAHDAEIAAEEIRTIPTAYFAPIPLQAAGARLGVIVLGSEAGRNRVILTETPMVSDRETLLWRLRDAHTARTASFSH